MSPYIASLSLGYAEPSKQRTKPAARKDRKTRAARINGTSQSTWTAALMLGPFFPG